MSVCMYFLCVFVPVCVCVCVCLCVRDMWEASKMSVSEQMDKSVTVRNLISAQGRLNKHTLQLISFLSLCVCVCVPWRILCIFV